ncbi:MAG: hypothetical protein WAL67_07545 [Candidatus Cybelea sp.]|jgi:hypothetical protein
MMRKFMAVALALAGLIISACGGHSTNGGLIPMGNNTFMLPNLGNLAMSATLPKNSIGEELPTEGLGTIKSLKWKAILGGFTQEKFSQALGFPPKTVITIHNLSTHIPHTLDYVKEVKAPPADFPKSPNLSIKAHGGGKFEAGYASGPIQPGKTVKMTLEKDGMYLIGCGYHYGEGMHTVLVVGKHATHGPQATPPGGGKPSPTPTPRSHSSYAPTGGD